MSCGNRSCEGCTRCEGPNELEASKQEATKYWGLLCDTVEALGKIAPEAAPYAPGWARKVREERDALRVEVAQLKQARDAASTYANELADNPCVGHQRVAEGCECGRPSPEEWKTYRADLAKLQLGAAKRLAKLRAEGWSVAVHNDYHVKGEFRTFWLLTHPCGKWIKGEGATDEEALGLALTPSERCIVSTNEDSDRLRALAKDQAANEPG